jgi:hypothetical protein
MQAGLEKEGVERGLQLCWRRRPPAEGLRLVRREWPTDIGPVDLMCRDYEDEWIAVEIKRVGTIEAVEQLTRYLERIRVDPAMADCQGVLAAQQIKPQARTLAESRGIACVEVDPEVLRGEREPDLRYCSPPEVCAAGRAAVARRWRVSCRRWPADGCQSLEQRACRCQTTTPAGAAGSHRAARERALIAHPSRCETPSTRRWPPGGGRADEPRTTSCRSGC